LTAGVFILGVDDVQLQPMGDPVYRRRVRAVSPEDDGSRSRPPPLRERAQSRSPFVGRRKELACFESAVAAGLWS
jgi:hypothetical protein